MASPIYLFNVKYPYEDKELNEDFYTPTFKTTELGRKMWDAFFPVGNENSLFYRESEIYPVFMQGVAGRSTSYRGNNRNFVVPSNGGFVLGTPSQSEVDASVLNNITFSGMDGMGEIVPIEDYGLVELNKELRTFDCLVPPKYSSMNAYSVEFADPATEVLWRANNSTEYTYLMKITRKLNDSETFQAMQTYKVQPDGTRTGQSSTSDGYLDGLIAAFNGNEVLYNGEDVSTLKMPVNVGDLVVSSKASTGMGIFGTLGTGGKDIRVTTMNLATCAINNSFEDNMAVQVASYDSTLDEWIAEHGFVYVASSYVFTGMQTKIYTPDFTQYATINNISSSAFGFHSITQEMVDMANRSYTHLTLDQNEAENVSVYEWQHYIKPDIEGSDDEEEYVPGGTGGSGE